MADMISLYHARIEGCDRSEPTEKLSGTAFGCFSSAQAFKAELLSPDDYFRIDDIQAIDKLSKYAATELFDDPGDLEQFEAWLADGAPAVIVFWRVSS